MSNMTMTMNNVGRYTSMRRSNMKKSNNDMTRNFREASRARVRSIGKEVPNFNELGLGATNNVGTESGTAQRDIWGFLTGAIDTVTGVMMQKEERKLAEAKASIASYGSTVPVTSSARDIITNPLVLGGGAILAMLIISRKF